MGGIGKNPHRPEGKARTDNPHMQAAWQKDGEPFMGNPSEKEMHQKDMENVDRYGGGPTTLPAEEQVGGSRPGVESRVKDAIARREEREAEDEE